jgi:signal recognition particle receptor subunit beta
MALVNHAKREINAKIVYYGPEGSGKRASLQYIYDRIKPSLRGELKSLPTGGNTLLFFDFSPFEKPVFGGYRLRFHMYSLTGKVANPAAWKMTLKGADGVVIVADASHKKLPAARESISQLRGYLASYGVGLPDMPCVLQLNSTDAGQRTTATVTAADLDAPDMPVCLSGTATGEGVLEALSQLSREIVARIGQSDAVRAGENGLPTAGGGDADTPAIPLPRESCERLAPPESTAMAAVDPATGWQVTGGDSSGVRVAVAGEGAECGRGVVRIPLDITLEGTTRRLVVSIAIETG